ncbi:hypothetical protein COCSUDRAFT_32092 [Coccomyxa subellipsoidea C-169]|uniref:Secreted peptide n=1 Tax=Coccomyxa subellipsoidea (strain C-169) TaxID=574566 RepID=I0ZAS4_COCSC|nr:hypothetical protein COCSUDRAFT_32092 [Coccomyxa subellipsoidea C-169]EIE27743.1 hypothetical protein COCSUDRAFT_32092 [Coccomyxa subellipsoidea C-169]|eukprot:XP_005652287.1 hypothetical protein COCSUDRAFT_32092 [Coccomyxa subellipsoidea C-169]
MCTTRGRSAFAVLSAFVVLLLARGAFTAWTTWQEQPGRHRTQHDIHQFHVPRIQISSHIVAFSSYWMVILLTL